MRVFRSIQDYVSFIAQSPLLQGELFCFSYIPSAFFPKDVVQYYFQHKDVTSEHLAIANSLWKFGRRMLSDLGQGRIRIAVEYSALRAFVERGVVHKASSNFEATIATRISVLNTFLKLMDSIYFLPEPAPYIFRLTPPDRIIIDVDNNNVGQTVQGLTFNDSSSYVAFAEEFDRLAQASRLAYPLEAIIASLRNVRDNLTKGAPVLM